MGSQCVLLFFIGIWLSNNISYGFKDTEARLSKLSLPAFTSGGKRLHVVVPIRQLHN